MYNQSSYSQTERYDRYENLDAAFPAVMRKVYVWMTMALAITGITAYGVANSPNLLYAIFSNQLLFWGMFIAEFALVVGLSAAINKISASTATLMFILYSVLNGVLLSSIFVVYELGSIATTFFVTAGTFGAMAVYGYTTNADLTKMGRILLMALIGLVIALVVNIFLNNTVLDLIISGIGVVLFTGLTAYDTQKIKQLSFQMDAESEMGQKMGVLGALTLYLDFVNLFLYLLRFLGNKKN